MNSSSPQLSFICVNLYLGLTAHLLNDSSILVFPSGYSANMPGTFPPDYSAVRMSSEDVYVISIFFLRSKDSEKHYFTLLPVPAN